MANVRARSTNVLIAATSIFAIHGQAMAQQEAVPVPSAATADEGVQDIVVTAQRRRETLQSVNIAATAITGDALTEKAVVRQLDLQYAAPGLSIVKAGLTESVNIRGIGLASGSPQVANGVASYLDGVFQPPIVSTGSFYDVQGIEVLRGPQGTLVGSNSTGGAIFINTNKPELGNLAGNVNLEYGSYRHLGADAAFNLPIGQTIAIRVAALDAVRKSYYTDIGSAHNDPDRLSEQDTRVQILWKPGRFQALLKSETIERDTGGYAYQPILGTPLANLGGRTGVPYQLNYNTPTSNFERAFIGSLELKFETAGGLTLRSLTAYQNKRINNLYDTDATSVLTVPVTGVATTAGVQGQNQFVRERQYSQEINIISPTSGKFSFILGGYFQRNKIDVRIFNFNSATGVPSIWIEPTTDKLTLGAFAQANYKLDSHFEIQAGVRYSHFHVDGTGGVYVQRLNPAFAPLGINVSPQTGTESDGRLTGKVALNYKPNSDHLFYAFVARGYKPGGINPPTPPNTTFRPETVIDYEAGWKGSFFRNHLRTQIGAFYNDYKNFQQSIQNQVSGLAGVANVASAKIKGFEAQAQGRFGGFSLDGGVAYTKSKLSSITLINTRLFPTTTLPQCNAGQAPGNPATCFDYGPFLQTTNGGASLYAPKWTWNAGAQYSFDIRPGSRITPRINYAYVGSQYTSLFYSPITDLIASHAILSGQITYTIDNVRFEFYGTNLTKRFYVSGQTGNNEFYGAPREFGLRFGAKF